MSADATAGADFPALARGGVAELHSRTAWALVLRCASLGLGFFMFVALARGLTPEAYAQFAFAYSLAFSIGIAAALGQPVAIVRFLPQYLARGQIGDAKGVILFGLGLCTLAGTVAFGAVHAAFAVLRGFAPDSNFTPFSAFAVGALTFLICISEYGIGVQRAAGRALSAILVRDVVWRLAFPGLVAALLFLGGPATSDTVIWLAAATLLVVVLWQGGAARGVWRRLSGEPPSFRPRRWLSVGVGLWIMVLLTTLMGNLDMLAVGSVGSPIMVGQYFNAMRVANLLSLPLFAASLVYAPLISAHHHSNDPAKLQEVCRQMSKAVAILSVCGFIALNAFGHHILAVFGPTYASATDLLRVLCIGALFNALCGACGGLLAFTGHERALIRILAMTVAAMALALPFALWSMGPMGAALVSVAGQILWNIWASAKGISLLGVDPTVLSLFRRRQVPVTDTEFA